MKQFRLLSLLLLVVLLTGCLAPTLRLSISPNPIKIEFGDEEIKDLKVKVSLSGFSFKYEVKTAEVVLKDHEGTTKIKETQNINKSFPVVPFISKTIDIGSISLDGLDGFTEDLYDDILKGKTYKLEITLKGTKDSSAKADVKFQ